MKSVLIANSNHDEIERIREVLSNNYNLFAITSSKEADHFLKKCDLILLDHNFTDNSGIDFLMEIIAKSYLPVMMIVKPEEPKCAIEAIRLGVYNYLFKTASYYELLNPTIKEAIDKFYEREEMKKTIITMKKYVAELEERLGINTKKAITESSDKQIAPQEKRASIIEEITIRLKRGEVNLPSYPNINVKFREMINKGASVAEVTDLLKKDMVISSKLLSMSNSAYYRGFEETRNLGQAISRLGLSVTKNCVEIISNRSLYTAASKKYNDFLKNLWEHSLSCAYASEFISRLLQLKKPDEVFTMGLLHDIGKLMLLQIVAELETRDIFGDGVDRMELLEIMDMHHGNFGAFLLKKWKFPEEYSIICKYHDKLEEADHITKELLVIHAANLLVKTLGYGQTQPKEIDILNADSSRFLKLTNPMITKVKEHVREIMQETSLSL